MTDVDARINELSADAWGVRVMQRLLSKHKNTVQERALGVIHSMQRLCRVSNTQVLSEKHSDTHPSGRFRIELTLRDPALRKALQCESSETAEAEIPNLTFCGFKPVP